MIAIFRTGGCQRTSLGEIKMLLFGSNTLAITMASPGVITGGLISLFLLGAIVGGIAVVIAINVMRDFHKDEDS